MRCLLLLGAWVVGALSAVAPAQGVVEDVLAGRSEDGRLVAWLSSVKGLWVQGWGEGPLLVGDGACPRFDARGALYFERTADDGHQVLSSSTWVVEPGRTAPRLVQPQEPVPAYQLPQVAGAPEGLAVKVCIDPGHGGSDPGAVGQGQTEKVMTLDIALRLRTWLARDTNDTRGGGSWSVLLTRTTDTYVGLTTRANMANSFGAASFTSIHCNSYSSSSANGTETYCYTGQSSKTGGALRNRIQNEALLAWALRNRGTKEASFTVLQATVMPAALLECGFISSPIDIVKIQSASQRDRLALYLLYALQQHHGYGRFTPASSLVRAEAGPGKDALGDDPLALLLAPVSGLATGAAIAPAPLVWPRPALELRAAP